MHGTSSDPGFCPKPPVSRNRYSAGSSEPLYPKMVAVRVKEKSSLSFSNSDRQMFLYRLYVKKSMRLPSRSSSSSDCFAFSMAWLKRFTYHVREY